MSVFIFEVNQQVVKIVLFQQKVNKMNLQQNL
jgi:hypothetical protein